MMEPLEGPLADLLAREAEANVPPPEAKARHWAAVGAAFGPVVPPPNPPASGAEATATATAAKGGALLKIVGGTLAAGALAAGVWAGRPSSPAPETAPAAVTEPETPGAAAPDPAEASPPVEPAEPADPVEPIEPVAPETTDPPPTEVTPPPPATAEPAPRRIQPAPAPDAPGLAEELALVEDMRRAVQAGDHAEALRLAKRHRKEFPRGRLRPDRLDLEASATCASGRLEAGRALAAVRQQQWPQAPISDRLETACKLDSP
jgi:hypothetical protein